MTRKYDAVVLRDAHDWSDRTVRLAVRISDYGPRADYLMADGTWKSVEEGASAGEPGIVLPPDALEAIVAAIEEFQGHTSHADTEARVLREWLAVERGRVDAALGSGVQKP